MADDDELRPATLAVLGVVAESPTHGFAVAGLFAANGDLGRVWRLPRPVIYRELARLGEAGLVREVGVETGGPGPSRVVVEVTDEGRAVLDRWLVEPVQRAREVRDALLLKLALLHRRGGDPRPLIDAQRAVFEMRARELGAAAAATSVDDFERTLLLWRLSSTRAALDFLNAVAAGAIPDDGE
ncbi:PadR family transcriptional regulator [Flexivirga meconopsidis]|uniref:PadR family transcriptional regulator n=1 Tax=Flexivirga meconopsidis TaxID=2977121 RepID=UPI00223F7B87